MESEENIIKVVLLGPGSAGKSSIVQRFVNNKFAHHSETTIGAHFISKTVNGVLMHI